jgi:hypothetical protein
MEKICLSAEESESFADLGDRLLPPVEHAAAGRAPAQGSCLGAHDGSRRPVGSSTTPNASSACISPSSIARAAQGEEEEDGGIDIERGKTGRGHCVALPLRAPMLRMGARPASAREERWERETGKWRGKK